MNLHEQLAQPSYWEPNVLDNRQDTGLDKLDALLSYSSADWLYRQVLTMQKSGVQAEPMDGTLLPPRSRVLKMVVDMRRPGPVRDEEKGKAVTPAEFDVLGGVAMDQNVALGEPAMTEVEHEGQPMMVVRTVLYATRSRLGSRVVEMSMWGKSSANGFMGVSQPAEFGMTYRTAMNGVLHDSKVVQAKLLHPLPDGEPSKTRQHWLRFAPQHQHRLT